MLVSFVQINITSILKCLLLRYLQCPVGAAITAHSLQIHWMELLSNKIPTIAYRFVSRPRDLRLILVLCAGICLLRPSTSTSPALFVCGGNGSAADSSGIYMLNLPIKTGRKESYSYKLYTSAENKHETLEYFQCLNDISGTFKVFLGKNVPRKLVSALINQI